MNEVFVVLKDKPPVIVGVYATAALAHEVVLDMRAANKNKIVYFKSEIVIEYNKWNERMS